MRSTMLTDSQPMDSPKPHPYLIHNSSSTTFHTSVSSFTHFTPTISFPLHSQTSLGDSIKFKARYPDPYSDNPFLPLKELRRLRSSEILHTTVGDRKAVLDGDVELLGDGMSALGEPHTPGLTPDSTASDEDLANVDFSPTSSTEALPYTSYFARTRRDSTDGFYTPRYQTAVSSDIRDIDSETEKAKAPDPCTPSRKRPPPIQVANQEPGSTPAQNTADRTTPFITVPEEDEDDDVLGSPRPRSVKLSGSSAFSLSLFPATPTTPMNRQSWARNSTDSSGLSSVRPRSLASPMAFSTPRTHSYRSVPATPCRRSYRATMEIDRPRRSEALFRPTRASVDTPRFPRPDTSSNSAYSQPTDSASFYSDAGPSRLRESSSSYMYADSAFETCAESVFSKDVLSRSVIGSCEDLDMLSMQVVPPMRKPVPRTASELIEMTAPKSRTSLSDAVPISISPAPTSTSAVSTNSTTVQSKPKPKKRKKARKLAIFHAHLNDESPRTTLSNTTLPIGPKVTHSDSIGSLRDELLGNGGLAKAKGKRSTKVKKPFDKYALPSQDQLELASDMYVYDETNRPIRFGDIFKDQKTAICFIRHFWCPLCQDYMSSIAHLTEPSLVHKAGVKLVIIGNGSPEMIKSYKTDVFRCPYEMYTDPGRKVYNALGMTLRTNDGGREREKGSYVKHGTFTGTMMVLKRAVKMPLANAGDIKQLGGEFILGPGLSCSFASRMHTTRSHTPIRDLLQAAGVPMAPSATELSILGSSTDSARWMDAQNEDMDNMIRKGLRADCGGDCPLDVEDKKPDLGEFRRLIERLKDSESKPEVTTYLVEVMGKSTTELDRLGAAMETRGRW